MTIVRLVLAATLAAAAAVLAACGGDCLPAPVTLIADAPAPTARHAG